MFWVVLGATRSWTRGSLWSLPIQDSLWFYVSVYCPTGAKYGIQSWSITPSHCLFEKESWLRWFSGKTEASGRPTSFHCTAQQHFHERWQTVLAAVPEQGDGPAHPRDSAPSLGRLLLGHAAGWH